MWAQSKRRNFPLPSHSSPAMAEPVPRSTPSKSSVKMDSSSSSRCSSGPHTVSSSTAPSNSTRSSTRSPGSIQSQPLEHGTRSSVDQVGAPDAHPPILICGCKEPACIITSGTANNPGRRFLKCRRRVQTMNCTCNRGIKGCYLWVWEDRLEEYVKMKSQWNQEQAMNIIMLDAARVVELKDEEIRRIRSELSICIKNTRISTTQLEIEVQKINSSRRIYMFLVVILLAWIAASRV